MKKKRSMELFLPFSDMVCTFDNGRPCFQDCNDCHAEIYGVSKGINLMDFIV